MRKGFLLVSCFALFWSLNGEASLEEKTQVLKKYQQKIGKQKGKLKRLFVQERSIHSELQKFATRSEKLEKNISSLGYEIQKTERTIQEKNERIQKLNQEIQQRTERVSQRLRDLYKWGSPSFFRVLLSARESQERQQGQIFLRRWIEWDRRMILEYNSLALKVSEEKNALETQKKQKSRLANQWRSRKKDLEIASQNKKDILALVENQREYYEKSIQELQRASANLQNLIEKLRDSDKEGSSDFARMKGRLLLPIQGKLERSYGPYVDPRSKATIYHKGIDIRASQGTTIQAVFDGKVVYSGWFTGYGKILILDHGGGYFTLYAHVSSLLKKEGDLVSVGEPIARVGDTGSLKGSYLYFELRKKGISENPMPWFSKKKKG